ncbi:MAG TPA: hypothetical protein PLN52_04820 [Opitutaceae bacterium]|nr:hypothetical protein [Opitutaceae bacterium]
MRIASDSDLDSGFRYFSRVIAGQVEPNWVGVDLEKAAPFLRVGYESAVAIVTVRASDGRLLELFPRCLTWDGRSVDYQVIECQEWIDLGHQEKVRNKQARFDRVHIVTRRGITTLDGLGHAVFPLMKSIDLILKAKERNSFRFEVRQNERVGGGE